MKRLLDVVVAALVSVLSLPVVAGAACLILASDGASPFYLPMRIGRHGRPFRMYKLRSMRIGADRTGVDSTAADDPRLTTMGRFLRRWKIDELPQFWNVLLGDMSLVGPRPNVSRETNLYTDIEQRMLSAHPGVTDLSSIVFADYSNILDGSSDPDLMYNRLIRPWKSRLALLYVDSPWSLSTDVLILGITATSLVSRQTALTYVTSLVERLGGDQTLQRVASRRHALQEAAPPGASEVVRTRLTNADLRS
jgi:lipopolysaccharide/colanic/teichoic acid biosynthesis glycosyltransferase